MAIIQVTPELLRGKATELRGYRGEHDEIMNKITNLVNGLPEQFKGQAAEAFIEKYNSMQPTFRSFTEMLESFAERLDNNANALEETDNTLASANRAD